MEQSVSAEAVEGQGSSSGVFSPRPAQARVLEYTGGRMAISAVPGAGKTFVLSMLAAQLVERLAAAPVMAEQEVLVVTFTNSGVENFRARIASILRSRGLLTGVGYRVRTLHALAHDIVRERPSLVGLSEEFDIINERTADDIKRELVIDYMRRNPGLLGAFIDSKRFPNQSSYEKSLVNDAIELTQTLIRVAKELQRGPAELSRLKDEEPGDFPLLNLGLHVYGEYQRALASRGAVDFDDLIVLALQAVRSDPTFLARLQARWPYILEDEAQDSSALQEQLLEVLTRSHGNWVRVGDPNQSINTTFTGSDTRFLQRFIRAYPEGARELPNSGRSALPLIDEANYLVEWSRTQHPTLSGDLALALPLIVPTDAGDPQPNPESGKLAPYLHTKDLTPDEEVDLVVRNLHRWLPVHGAEQTVAVLAPENAHGFKLTERLEQEGIPFDDSLLKTDARTRAGAHALSTVLTWIAQPPNAQALATVWREVWWPHIGMRLTGAESSPDASLKSAAARRKMALPLEVEEVARSLRSLRQVEDFLYGDWGQLIEGAADAGGEDGLRSVLVRVLAEFRADATRWSRAARLPVDELVLTLGNDIFAEPAELALAHHLALRLDKVGRENPRFRLPEFAGELRDIAQNKLRIIGLSDDDSGFVPQPGVVTVGTMHSAKGLEWDRVYLMAVNTFGFPSGLEGDKYRGERYYLWPGTNLTAEGEAQLRLLAQRELASYSPGTASAEARRNIAAERLRLLYVGITRARRELIVTANIGRFYDRDPVRPALALEALALHSKSRGG